MDFKMFNAVSGLTLRSLHYVLIDKMFDDAEEKTVCLIVTKLWNVIRPACRNLESISKVSLNQMVKTTLINNPPIFIFFRIDYIEVTGQGSELTWDGSKGNISFQNVY